MSFAVRPNISQPSLRSIVRIKILQVLQFAVSKLVSGIDEIVFCPLGSESAARNVDWTVIAMMLTLSAAMIGFKLNQEVSIRMVLDAVVA